MCGIFGITKFSGDAIRVDDVIKARDIITHRGPDDAGVFTTADKRTVLAHRRLSIIDLSELGHQPMSTADGRYTIVFNGEIYNYAELRERLEGRGGIGDGGKEVGSGESSVLSQQSTIGKEREVGGREEEVGSRRLAAGMEEEVGGGQLAVHSLQSAGDGSVGKEEEVGGGQLAVHSLQSAGDGSVGKEEERVGSGESSVHSLQSTVGKGGLKFRSHSDTEVLLYLYAEYGSDCLKFLRGMFAFVIWDEKEKKLFGARDRFGIKPFYYLHNKNEFIFSSELKAIKFYKDNLTVSMKAVDAFLRTGSVPSPLTIYNETFSLEPGSWIKIDASGNVDKCKWWSFEDLVKNNSRVKVYNADAREEIREALLDSVRSHCIADVEVGAFLSGGIDSTSVVSLMKQTGYHKIKTISISFPGNKLDESKYARLAADNYMTAHYEYNLEEGEVVERLYDLIGMMDQPTIDGVNTYFISRAAKDFGLKVVMSGLGGDELFGGYPSFKNVPRVELMLKAANAFPLSSSMMNAGSYLGRNILPAKAIDLLKNPLRENAGFKLFRGLFTDIELRELGFVSNGNSSESNNFRIAGEGLSPLQRVSQFESVFYMGNMLLRDSDQFSMLNSLELRVPFVDHRLYESVYPYIDSSFDFKYPKRMLVEGTGDIPSAIVFRPKMGFTFPFADWIKSGKLGEVLRDSLLTGQLSYFDRKGIEKLFKRVVSGKTHWSRLWAVNIVERFDG